jgi:hypothetical protein
MIARGLLPACPSAAERLVFTLVSTGWLPDIPGIDSLSPVAWFALPAAVIAIAAILAARLDLARVLVVALAGAVTISPWLPVILAPLPIALRSWPRRRQWLTAAPLALAIALGAYLLSPSCEVSPTPETADLLTKLALLGRVLGVVGASGLVLALLQLLYGPAHRFDFALLVVAIVSVAIASIVNTATNAIVLAPAATALGCLAIAGALRVFAWQTTWSARAGVAALVAVAVLTIVPRGSAGDAASGSSRPTTASLWSRLDHLPVPAAVVDDGTTNDVAVSVWRAARRASGRTLQIANNRIAVGAALSSRAVYAWPATARALGDRGFVTAQAAGDDEETQAPMGRIVNAEPCVNIAARWAEVAAVLDRGQVSVLFTGPVPSASAIIYLPDAAPRHAAPLGWPRDALPGFERLVFERSAADAWRTLESIAARDGMDLTMLGDAPVVTRVRVERRTVEPDALPVELDLPAGARAWVSLMERDGAHDHATLCRRSVGLTLAGYEGGPSAHDLDLTSSIVVGQGWHLFETVGDARYRWTALPDADLRFIVHQPGQLSVRLDAEPAAGLRVSLNGVPATCDQAQPPCDWILPVAAMREGMNILTLHSTPVPAPPPDPRRLGLMVRSVRIFRP